MATPTFTKAGTKATTPAKLDKAIFAIEEVNPELLKQAYVAYLANGRQNLAVTKTRGQVRGGGKKPWRQKGTGRARFGSSRNPIWRGGGIAFGPTGMENYSHKITTAAKRQALRQALSMANADGKLVVIESFESKEGKTAKALALLQKINATGSVLLVVELKEPQLMRATSNLSQVKLVIARYLNVFDVMNADTIVISHKALETVHEWLAASAKTKPAAAKETT